MSEKKLLSISQAAKQLGVSDSTLRRMADEGQIEHIRLPRGGYRRFTQDEIDRVKLEMETGKAAA